MPRWSVAIAASSADARDALASGMATPDEYRLFMGYAGWAPSQLEGECANNTWFAAEGVGQGGR